MQCLGIARKGDMRWKTQLNSELSVIKFIIELLRKIFNSSRSLNAKLSVERFTISRHFISITRQNLQFISFAVLEYYIEAYDSPLVMLRKEQ